MRSKVSRLGRAWAALHLHWRALVAARFRHGRDARDQTAPPDGVRRDATGRDGRRDNPTRDAGHRAHDVTHGVTHRVHDVADKVAHRAHGAAEKVAHHAHDVVDDIVHDVHQDYEHWARGQPVLERPRRPILRAFVYSCLALLAIGGLASAGFWWRLSNGPVAFDVVTPWLTAAIEERFGGNHRVEVGGTQIERDESGHTAIRLRDVVVRDRDGAKVASAPKAEVGISPAGLLTGQVQAVRLSLIGAKMGVRVEADGTVTIFTDTDSRPIASAPIIAAIPQRRPQSGPDAVNGVAPAASSADVFAALLAWLDGIDVLGLDGRDLSEIGLKNGTLVVDDRRSNKQWTFDNINLSLTRPKEGGVALTMSSSGTDGPWSMTATVTPRGEGRRAIEAVVRDISPKDIMLALRVSGLEADMPISAIVRAELAADGSVLSAEGRVVAGAGFIGRADDSKNRLLIDEAQIDWRWDPANRVLTMPIEVHAGANRITLMSQLQPPGEAEQVWSFAVTRGRLVLASVERLREPPLVLDRVSLQGRFDPVKRRLEFAQGDVAGMAASLAFSGSIDYSGAEPWLSVGLAATRMSVGAFKRLWPVFVSPDVRAWVIDHVPTGTVDRVDIAANVPLSAFKPGGPPAPDNGLSIEVLANVVVRPIDNLPAIRDADLVARISGRRISLAFNRGTIELPSGRKLIVSKGLFEVADTALDSAKARLSMRVDGQVEGAVELAAMEPLRGIVGIQLDPATTRGTIGGQVTLNWPLASNVPPGALQYTIEADIANFAAERVVRGMKAEATSLHVSATPQYFQVKGDAKIGNAMVTVDYRRNAATGDADVRAQTVLDNEARAKLGFDLGGAVNGPVPVRFSGRVGAGNGDNRFAVDADLTQVSIAELLPGWTKFAGKAARATFILVEKSQSRRIEDLVLEGAGARVKGAVELDAAGDIVSANFPVFGLSENDRASIKADRGPDGTLRVTMRGEVFDGRGFLRASMVGPAEPNSKRSINDLDLDIKLGAVAGFHGEVLSSLDLRLSRRNGEIRSFAMNAKVGQYATLTGDMRGRAGRLALYFVTDDAGALFRFTNMYSRMYGGDLQMTIDPPRVDHAPQNGLLNIREFVIRGEHALDSVAASAPPGDAGPRQLPGTHGVQFAHLQINFTRLPGRIAIREGYVWGTSVGATMDGLIDFARNDVHLRGTFVPGYSLNNLPAKLLPLFGTLLTGGTNEGLLGVTYEVVGPPGDMILRVNPMSLIAPGFLRKLFEFRRDNERMGFGAEPTR